MTATTFGYLILISMGDGLIFYFFVSSLVFVSNEKTYQTLKTMFNHVSKHLEVRQNFQLSCRSLEMWSNGSSALGFPF